MSTRSPFTLITIGLISAAYGINLIKRGWDHDTLMPGTNFTYLPQWILYLGGVLLQIPLLAAIFFLKSIGYF